MTVQAPFPCYKKSALVYATAPVSIALSKGYEDGVLGSITDVAMPVAGGTDTTGVAPGWVTGTADTIRFTVTDSGAATSTITINDAAYTSGTDYAIASAGTLTIVVTTSEAGKTNAVRTFSVAASALVSVSRASYDNWTDAFAAISAGQAVTIPAATTYNGNVTVPANKMVVGLNGTTSQIDGLVTMSDGSVLANLAVADTYEDRAITAVADAITIQNCYIVGTWSWAAVHMNQINNSWVCGNTVSNDYQWPDGPDYGQNIIICKGESNRIIYNTLNYGKTNIIFMWGRDNGDGLTYPGIVRYNEVAYNYCIDTAEESITFDSKCSDEYNNCLERDFVASVSGADVTLPNRTWPDWTGYYMAFLTGTQQGHCYEITAVSGNTFTLDTVPTGAAGDDEIIICAPAYQNWVHHNEVHGGWDGILMYGLAFRNTIEDNETWKIECRCLDDGDAHTGSATGAGGRYPCGYNTIRDNTVHDMDNHAVDHVGFFYYNLPDNSNYSTAFVCKGNNAINNTDSPEVYANNQWFYHSGSGTLTDGGGNTVSETEMVW